MMPTRRFGIAREGRPIISFVAAAAAIVAIAAWVLAGGPGALVAISVGIILTAWSAWFFRDPERRTPNDPAAIVSAADGVVCRVGPATPPPEARPEGDDAHRMTCVSVFMNIFDVHVNRAPAAGTVERITHRPGRFFNASLDKASEENERLSIVLRLADGREIVVVQIAGLIARRIVCRIRRGDRLEAGERFGLIRFGSRVDHYLPEATDVLARLNDRVRAGETIIARLKPKA